MAQPIKKAFLPRRVFNMAVNRTINWAGTQKFGSLEEIKEKFRKVHCVIEVHDARIPRSGRNINFIHSITQNGRKPHILVLNKRDLTDRCDQFQIKRQLTCKQNNKNIIFTSCRRVNCSGVKRILPLSIKLLTKWESRTPAVSHQDEFNIMLTGIPNVGKRSLLNLLRRNQLNTAEKRSWDKPAKFLIHQDPDIYVLNEPNVIGPNIPDDETGMKLALVGTIPNSIIDESELADYLLYWLNKHKQFGYVTVMGLHKPTDDIQKLLRKIAQQHSIFKKMNQMNKRADQLTDFDSAAKYFLKLYHNCELGGFNLDQN